MLIGNLPEIYDVLNVKWHHEATRKYGAEGGGVFQIHGMFGVCLLLVFLSTFFMLMNYFSASWCHSVVNWTNVDWAAFHG